jgi:hypothetical protein
MKAAQIARQVEIGELSSAMFPNRSRAQVRVKLKHAAFATATRSSKKVSWRDFSIHVCRA